MERSVNNVIDKLKTIKKGEVDERTFYEMVLSALNELPMSFSEEEAKLIKETLLEIGCISYREWKRTQIQRVKVSTPSEAAEDGNIATAVNFINQFLGTPSNAIFSVQRLLDDDNQKNGWITGWLRGSQTYREEQVKKFGNMELSPYKRVAKRSLTSWGGMTEEEALEAVNLLSNEELEEKVYATGSMNAAINQIANMCNLTQEEKEQLNDIVYNGLSEKNKGVANLIKQRITSAPKAIIDTLFAVHNSWVETNRKKFLARDKKYQHMPSEFIGWDELKLDLLFAKPIFDTLGIAASEDELKKEYITRIKEYFLNKKLVTTQDTVDLIQKGDEFYPSLRGQQDNIEFLKDEDNIREEVIPAIKENGIGETEIVRFNILYYISKTVQRKDLMRIEPKELQIVRDFIQKEIENAEEYFGENSEACTAARIRLIKVDTFIEERERGELNGKKNEDVDDE